jgi:glyoxylate reductase
MTEVRRQRILITEPVEESTIQLLRDFGDVTVGRRGEFDNETALAQAFTQHDAALTMLSNPVTEAVLRGSGRIRIVANYAVGLNNIDIRAASILNIFVANTPDVLSQATADIALMLLLDVARKSREAEISLRNGEFDGWHPFGFVGVEMHGKTALIIGMGRIGKAIAQRLRGFGIRVMYHNRNALSASEESSLGVQFTESLDQAVCVSDFVFLSCPLTPQTRHIMGANRLSLLKPEALLINIGRGPLVDEAALARALHDGKLGGAGLDVFELEPVIHPDLLTAPNAVLLPHIGSATRETRQKMGHLAANAILGILRGDNPDSIVNLVRH